jgi:hypothetical protein
MKPLLQLLGLALEDILSVLGRAKELKQFRKELQHLKDTCGTDLEAFAKMREKSASAIVKNILFDPVLIHIENRMGNQKGMDVFLKKRA